MSEATLQKKLDKATVHGGLWATAAALLVGYLTQDATLLPLGLFIPFGLIVIWALLALVARAIFARHTDLSLSDSKMIVRWIGARMALFFAATILLFCWLVALPIGTPWSGFAGRALILTLLVSFLTSAAGQAAINSAILMATFRREQADP
jgi:hypothetical protein